MKRNQRHAIGATLALLLLVASLQIVSASDPREALCPAGKHLSTFSVVASRNIWAHLPKMGANPELRTDDPAFVVVYDGPVDLMAAYAPPPMPRMGLSQTQVMETTYEGVVCVVLNNQPIVYADVDLAGLAP